MIVVFGSINLDVVFPVPALPRRGETVLSEGRTLSPGGKGANQALAAARSGAAVALFGCVGRDVFAEPALFLLRSGGVDLDGVRRVAAPTGLAAVGVDARGDNQIIVAGGANRRARARDVPDAVLAPATVVLMQLEIPMAEVGALARRARARGARVILNAAPAAAPPGEILEAVDVFAVNRIEAGTLARALGIEAAEPEEAASRLAREIGRPVVVTLGARGAAAFGAGPDIRVGALPVAPRDTTGAGDAFVGAFAAALARGGAIADALRHGCVAGGLACRGAGAQGPLPTLDEIKARLTDLRAPP